MSIIEDEALSEAVQMNRVPDIRKALAAGANPDSWIPVHQHMLLASAYLGGAEAVDALLDAGCNPLATDRDERNAYHKAAQGMPIEEHLRTAIVRRLKDVGPDPDDTDKLSMTPLAYAASNDLSAVARALVVECGATIDAVDQFGNTPAHIAAARGSVDALYGLLMLGADADSKNHDGLSVQMVAENAKRPASVEAIARYKALPEIDPATVEPSEENLRNPKLWKQAEQVLDSWRERGIAPDLDVLHKTDANRRSPVHVAMLCGKLSPLLGYMQEHAVVKPEHLRDGEGKPTPFCQLLVASEQCGNLFSPLHWKGQDTEALHAVYHALPEEGREQVSNYHMLAAQMNVQQHAGRGR